MLLNNQWVTEEIKEEIKKYVETNDNKNMTVQETSFQTGRSCILVPENLNLNTSSTASKLCNFEQDATFQ